MTPNNVRRWVKTLGLVASLILVALISNAVGSRWHETRETDVRLFEAVGALLALLGVGGAIYECLLAWRAVRASGWPTVSGRVMSSLVEDGPPQQVGVGWKYQQTQKAVVAYAYEVGGRQWIAHRVLFGDQGLKTDGSAFDLVRKYPPAAAVRVSYDPADPSNAVLETGLRVEHVKGFAAGLLLCGLGVVIATGYFRHVLR